MRLASGRTGALAIGLLAAVLCFLALHFRGLLFPAVLKSSRSHQPTPPAKKNDSVLEGDNITIVMVTCESGLELTLTNLKSILAFSRASFRLIIYADAKNIDHLQERIMNFPDDILKRLKYDLRLVMFPKKYFHKWKQLFAPCATQRLFLPDMLPKEEAVLYLDADILLLRPVEELWRIFHSMGPSHLIAQSYEIEDMDTNPYRHYGSVPYVKPYGVNAGVMPMNLTRMRNFNWGSRMEPLLEQYGSRLKWADQDIVNVIFNENPDKLYLMPCTWNFRRDNCEFHESCKGEVPGLLHANQKFFIRDDEPALRAAQLAMREYQLGTSLERNFIGRFEERLTMIVDKTLCTRRFLEYMKDWKALARQLDKERGLNPDLKR